MASISEVVFKWKSEKWKLEIFCVLGHVVTSFTFDWKNLFWYILVLKFIVTIWKLNWINVLINVNALKFYIGNSLISQYALFVKYLGCEKWQVGRESACVAGDAGG